MKEKDHKHTILKERKQCKSTREVSSLIFISFTPHNPKSQQKQNLRKPIKDLSALSQEKQHSLSSHKET